MMLRVAAWTGAAILALAVLSPDEAPVPAAPVEPSLESGKAHVEARRGKSSRKKKKTKKRSRRASKARRNNMPAGWSWPPSDAMKTAGKACLARLDELGVTWKRASSTRKVATPVTLPAMELGGVRLVSTYRKGPFVMDCHLAEALAAFSGTLHAAGVRELHFSRIHDYTQVRVNGDIKRALSRHALGVAIDIRAFVDEGGRKAVVLDDYPLGDELLLAVEQQLNDAGTFRTILTPRNDPASHDDHFHIEVIVDYTRPRAASL